MKTHFRLIFLAFTCLVSTQLFAASLTVDGNFGVNVLTPQRPLHIKQLVSNRALRIEHETDTDYWENGIGVTTNAYKFYYNNTAKAEIRTTGDYWKFSDARLKRDIQSMGPVLSKVARLNPATYQYNDNSPDSSRSMGFTAQNVEKVFPILVSNLDDGYKGVLYDGFAVISIKAIQELNEEMTKMHLEMEARLDAREARLDAIEAKLEAAGHGVAGMSPVTLGSMLLSLGLVGFYTFRRR